jgi:hypothetical protein
MKEQKTPDSVLNEVRCKIAKAVRFEIESEIFKYGHEYFFAYQIFGIKKVIADLAEPTVGRVLAKNSKEFEALSPNAQDLVIARAYKQACKTIVAEVAQSKGHHAMLIKDAVGYMNARVSEHPPYATLDAMDIRHAISSITKNARGHLSSMDIQKAFADFLMHSRPHYVKLCLNDYFTNIWSKTP